MSVVGMAIVPLISLAVCAAVVVLGICNLIREADRQRSCLRCERRLPECLCRR